MKIDFKWSKKAIRNKIFIQLNFEGGDADTQHTEIIEIKDVRFSNWEVDREVIETFVEKYKILEQFDRDTTYEEVLEEYGEEIVGMYEDIPSDPSGDFQWKCYLSSIKLLGYDEEGNEYSSYV